MTATPASGGGGVSTPGYSADVSGGGTLNITVNKASGSASATAGGSLGAGMQSGGNETVSMPAIPGVTSYTLGIPAAYLSTSGGGTLTFRTDTGSMTLPAGMLSGIEGSAGKKAGITISAGDQSDLSEAAKAAVGARPLITLSLTLDGQQSGWSNPDAPVAVSIPYTPTAEELQNPDAIVIWYLDGGGNPVCVPNGRYDAATGTVVFTTTHFSLYAVGYNAVSFNDVPAGAWFEKAVDFIAARGITGSTGGGSFSPDAKLTRGDFLVMLMKAYGIAPDENFADNFSDAGDTYYTGYLAAAKRIGISTGTGNNEYAPDREITRQEMFTLLYNALKVIGQLPQCDSGRTLSGFADAGQIEPWATEAMTLLVETGTISGEGGLLNPTDTTTRAQMAQVLYNMLGK